MTQNKKFAGLGELICDHLFMSVEGQTFYQGTRGGGSVFNTLANLSLLEGCQVLATGVGGEDEFGTYASLDLHNLGVHTDGLRLLKDRATQIIFERIAETRTPDGQPIHTFSGECVACGGSQQYSTLAKMEYDMHFDSEIYKGINVLCLDKISKFRMKVARSLKAKDVSLALDLGRIGHLRYTPVAQILSDLSLFDVVLMPEEVGNSLIKRVGLADLSHLSSIGPQILFVSSGHKGMLLYDSRNGKPVISKLDAPNNVVVKDAAGAGDAFFARLLFEALQSLPTHKKISDISTKEFRRLAEKSINGLTPVLSSIGARGHIKPPFQGHAGWGTSLIGNTVDDIMDIDNEGVCIFCKSPRMATRKGPSGTRKRSKMGFIGNTSLLVKRTLFALERQDAVEKCRAVLTENGGAYIIGTGGSFPVAMFLSQILNHHSNLLCQPIHPFDYARISKKTEVVIVVTYSGSTQDCAYAIQSAIKHGVRRIVLVTGASTPQLAALLRNDDVVISYARAVAKNKVPSMERGFVSLTGTIAPCALWTSAVFGVDTMIDLVNKLTSDHESMSEKYTEILLRSLVSSRVIPVFGGGFAWPAMLDLESKFVEGNLCPVQLHEVKDFSHGRFMSVFNPGNLDIGIFLSVANPNPYESYLLKSLKKERDTIFIQSSKEGSVGALELMIKLQFFIRYCGEVMNKDISRPATIPAQGLRLYKWKKGI